MNYPDHRQNPAWQALHRAVEKAKADGAPVYVNQPKAYTTFPGERLVYLHRNREALVTAVTVAGREYVACARDGFRTDYPHRYAGPASGDTRVFWDNPEWFTKGFRERAAAAIRARKGM
jgi:hypothetical protein